MTAGMNGGWIQIVGPGRAHRAIQGDRDDVRQRMNLQQIRWPPTNIADSPAEALSRLFMPARLALQRSGIQLEMGGGARRHRLRVGPRARPAVSKAI